MTDTSTLRERITLQAFPEAQTSDEMAYNLAIHDVLRLLDAHTAAQPAPTRKEVMPSDQAHHSAASQHETSPGLTAGAIQPASDAVAEAELRGMREAVTICKKVRNEYAENDDQAVGALDCALAIMGEVNARDKDSKLWMNTTIPSLICGMPQRLSATR